jgi:hypothetical protein
VRNKTLIIVSTSVAVKAVRLSQNERFNAQAIRMMSLSDQADSVAIRTKTVVLK